MPGITFTDQGMGEAKVHVEVHQIAGSSGGGPDMTSTPTEKGARKANARKFYIMDPDPRVRSVGGFEIENLRLLLDGRRVLGPPPSQRGFANSPEPPRLLIDRALGRAPLDLEQYHQYWLVSDRMKNILAGC